MKLYQAKVKQAFLETVAIKEFYEWLFNKLFEYESKLGKDLYDFYKEELLDFYKEANSAFSTLRTYNSMIKTYIDWAIKEQFPIINVNAASQIDINELRKIAKPDPSIIHVDTIYEIIGKTPSSRMGFQLKNAQDKLLIYLIFLGLNGNYAKELTELKKEHIDWDNKLIKTSEFDPYRKDVVIDEYALELISQALEEKKYLRYMDSTDPRTTNTREDYGIDEGYGYIFRKANLGKSSNKPNLSHQGLLARLSALSKYTGEKLTISRIRKSGMAYVVKMLIDNNISLTVDNPVVQKSLFERFDITEYQRQIRTLREAKRHVEEVYGDG